MCVAPLTIWIGKGGDARELETACHKCWQCRANAVKDWVGRNIAESRTAKGCHAITLTYGRDPVYGTVDHLRSAILTYSDVQKWFKLLRYHGFPCRYFVTGEWGTLKGRAHWHIMAYWTREVPPGLQLDKQCVVQNHWDEGFSFYTAPNYKQIWYNCKYILKGQGELDQRVLPRMSKNPALGAWYFAGVAREYVRQGLAPQSLEYTFPEVRKGKGQDGEFHRFRLGGRSAELFLQAYIDGWRLMRGSAPRPASELVDDFEEWGRVINPDTFHYRPEPEGRAFRAYQGRDPRVIDKALASERREFERASALDVPFNELMERIGYQWQGPQTNEVSGPQIMRSPRRFLTE